MRSVRLYKYTYIITYILYLRYYVPTCFIHILLRMNLRYILCTYVLHSFQPTRTDHTNQSQYAATNKLQSSVVHYKDTCYIQCTIYDIHRIHTWYLHTVWGWKTWDSVWECVCWYALKARVYTKYWGYIVNIFSVLVRFSWEQKYKSLCFSFEKGLLLQYLDWPEALPIRFQIFINILSLVSCKFILIWK